MRRSALLVALRMQTDTQRFDPDLIPRRTYQNLRPRGGRAPACSIPSLQPVVLGTLGIQLEEERDH